MFKKFLLIAVLFFLVYGVPASAATSKLYKNRLPQNQWAKYGVNPWRADTDNDGYKDEWEVKNKYCPTNPEQIKINDPACKKGAINLAKKKYTPPAAVKKVSPREVRTFTSCANMRQELAKLPLFSNGYYLKGAPLSTDLGIRAGEAIGLGTPAADSAQSTDYSSTNVQVEGVDEGDIVKTDGKYIYNIAQKTLYITAAVPADSAKLISKTVLDDISNAQEIYIDGNYLMVIGYNNYNYPMPLSASKFSGPASGLAMPYIYPYYRNYLTAEIWDLSNKQKPTLMRSLDFDGNLMASRMTNGYVYLVMNGYPQYRIMNTNTLSTRTIDLMPTFRDLKGKNINAQNSKVEFAPAVFCANVDYIYPIRRSDYLQIAAIPLKQPLADVGKKVVLGAGSQVYMSTNNLYVAAPTYSYMWNQPSTEQTEIFKFTLAGKQISLVGSQTVPGTLLNQFSMDEYKNNFRLVSTIRDYTTDVYGKYNSLYVLDKDLNKIGWYKNFGQGERIYAARFMGERAYVVTFLETDPLFVFDLSIPIRPQLLGALKIPGYSTYLHPYDATHIIGIGKNATANTSTPGFAWYQGVKLGLFDVTDPNNPVQMFSTEIGDRGTDSLALTDHHAFLFSKEKNLLAFPISLAQFTPEQKSSTSTASWEYGKTTFQGLYAYNVDLNNGFRFLGGVSHIDSGIEPDNYWYYGNDIINRSLYIGNNLYALSNQKLTIHTLADLTLLNEIMFEPNAQIQARDARRLSDLKQIQTALELYYTDNNRYPSGSNAVLGQGNYACFNINGWQESGCTGTVYMSQVPADPKGGQYVYSLGTNTFTVTARLEGIINELSGNVELSPTGITQK